MVAPLDTHASRFLTMASQAPKVFTLHGVPRGGGGSGNLPIQDPTTSMELRCHTTSSIQTHLTGFQLRELLCFRSGALRSWDPMVVETWIEMLREKLKHISTLLRLGASIDTFLGVERPVCIP
jgi:hypothetical protein